MRMIVKYKIIYEQLKQAILDGTYPEGHLIPGEYQLMRQMDVSRDTIRKAMALLTSSGYIQKIRGKGSMVIAHNNEVPLTNLISFKELGHQQGFKPKTKIVEFKDLIITDKLAKETGFAVDTEVWSISRLRFIDGVPSIIDLDLIRKDLAPDMTKQAIHESLYEYLEGELGLTLAYSENDLTAPLISTKERETLELDATENRIIQIESRVYLNKSEQLQYSIAKHRPDKFAYHEFIRRNNHGL
ncbi:MAG: trehalose operon repressor [Lactobacillaceae bacterium]|jgi:GntR family trehalose operon transcriptional repressor|nr:trehalose operon repressor [Lactobacillaceae bacterium]